MEENKKKTTKKVTKKEPAKKKTILKKKEEKIVVSPKEEVVEKKEVKEPKGESFKEFISSYKFLYTTFGILFIIVILLAIMVFTRSNEAQEKNSNIVFSIMEKETKNSLNMDLESLVGKEYTLKVANYRAGKISNKTIDYTITINNPTNVELEVLADNKGENLITNQEKTVIHGDGFGTNSKEEVIYYFRVKNADNLKKGDSIQIVVES